MKNVRKRANAKLYPSELVTIGILFALKGNHFRAFYRWLKRDYDGLFGGAARPDTLATIVAGITKRGVIDF